MSDKKELTVVTLKIELPTEFVGQLHSELVEDVSRRTDQAKGHE